MRSLIDVLSLTRIDFPVRSNFGTLNGSEEFRNARFFHIAADWKVRAPFLTPPRDCRVLRKTCWSLIPSN